VGLFDRAHAALFPTTRPSWLPRNAAREALAIWALCFAGVVIGFLIWRPAAKIIATIGFLYLPLHAVSYRREDWPEYGLSMRQLGKDVKLFALVSAIVFPLFIAGYFAFTWLWPQLPAEWMRVLTPYTAAPRFEFRLPDRFTEWAIDDLFVVALPEEFFYRGYVQSRLRDAWHRGQLFHGASLVPAFWITVVLFAAGTLTNFGCCGLRGAIPRLIFGGVRG